MLVTPDGDSLSDIRSSLVSSQKFLLLRCFRTSCTKPASKRWDMPFGHLVVSKKFGTGIDQ